MEWIRSWVTSWWAWFFPSPPTLCDHCSEPLEMAYPVIPKDTFSRKTVCYPCMIRQKECVFCPQTPEALSYDSLSHSFVVLCADHYHWESKCGQSELLITLHH